MSVSMILLLVGVGLALLVGGIVFLLWLRHWAATRRYPARWRTRLAADRGFEMAQAEKLSITVLLDWPAKDENFVGDAGVSYLLDVDGKKVLFDLGDRYGSENPDPVADNLRALGLEPAAFAKELDAVVISHHHRDHVGGLPAQLKKSLRFPADVIPDCTVYLPKPLKSAARTEVLDAPREIFPGVAATGPLPGWMFFLGDTPEQMLVVNLPQGLVMISGCGHPGVGAMARYARQITGRPLFAFFGGAHAIIDHSRGFQQRVIGAKNPFWRPTTPEDIGVMAVELSDAGVQKVYLSTHDADQWATNIFESVFQKDLVVIETGGTYSIGD